MELGYNTDIVFGGEPFHVQTEGYVKEPPRIDTLVYRKGVILHRLSVPDAQLSTAPEHIEETKRKIRQQHLMAVSIVQRGELDKLDRIRDVTRYQDPFATLPEEAQRYCRSLWKQGARDLGEKLLDLVRVRVLSEDLLGPTEDELLQQSLAQFLALLSDEELPFYRKQSLVSALLLADSTTKLFDRHQALVAQEGYSFPPMDELYLKLCHSTSQLIQLLFQQSRKGSELANDFLLNIFSRQSLCLVRYLFEEAEKRFVAAGRDDAEHRSILPMVLLLLEERFVRQAPDPDEVANVLDRLNYVYARLDVETFQEIEVEILRIRRETGRTSPLSEAQRERIAVYKGLLEETVRAVGNSDTLSEKLAIVNRRREEIVGWERLLMLDVDLRLALKMYASANTELFIQRAQEVALELEESLARRPMRGVRLLLRTLEQAVTERENIGRIASRALLAEGYLATLRKGDVDDVLSRAEVKTELERIVTAGRRSTAVIVEEIGRLKMNRRDQLFVARRLLEGGRLSRALREELDTLVMSRYPSEVIMIAAERIEAAGGMRVTRSVTLLEDAIDVEDGAWLAHGGASGFEQEFELGFEAATLQRLLFPGRSDAASAIDEAMTASGFSFAQVSNRGGKPAFVYRSVVARGRQKSLDQAPPAETEMKGAQEARAREALTSFEREIKGISANLEIRVAQLVKLADELGRVPSAIESLKAHYRPLISTNRRLAEKLQSFEGVVMSIVDPLVKSVRKAQERGHDVAPLILSQMASDDRRRELVDLLARLMLHELVVGLGDYARLRESLHEVLEGTLPQGTPEWEILDVPKLQYLLVAKGFPSPHVALILSFVKVNERFFVDLKPRKAVRCRMDKMQKAVYGGLY